MRFMLLIYQNENSISEAEWKQCLDESLKLAHELHAKGQFVSASPLHPTPTASSVRIRDGRRMVTDGPFAETHEHLGGYYIVDVETRNDAVAIAERIPGAARGTVEVRQIMDVADLPKA